jgi:hypothetical protein
MPALSDMPGAYSTVWDGKHIPFTIYLRANVHGRKRQEKYSDLQKYSAYIESLLENVCTVSGSSGSTLYSFDFTKPVAFTNKFAGYPYRFTINGHACRRDTFTKTPVGQRIVINDNQFKTGPGAANASNKVPDADVNIVANELKTVFESLTGLSVLGIRVANYRLGYKSGTHMP